VYERFASARIHAAKVDFGTFIAFDLCIARFSAEFGLNQEIQAVY
jgi:hypothetical protein